MPNNSSKKASCFLFLVVVLTLAASAASAQIAQPDNNVEQAGGQSSSTVTASATTERVRFTAPNTVVQLRLEVYDEAGQKLLDTEQRGGNVIDWHIQGGSGERVSDGVYLCVLTSKNLSGRLSQKLGRVNVSGQSTEVRSAAVAELNLRQAQSVGPVETGEAGLTVMGAGDAPPVTVLANNGDEAQLARTRGALTFRVGDFFSGNDKEQMRLTEDGNLGIGTAKPTAKLDVAGTIRAERVLIAKPKTGGSNPSQVGSAQAADAADSVQPLVAGTGTQDRLAKWTDNAGTLGNTQVSESNGSVVVGNAGQVGNIQIFGPADQDVFAGMGPDVNAGPAFNYGYAGNSFGRSAGFFNVRPDASAVAPNPSLRFATGNVQRMIIDNVGRVGINNLTPGFRLDVAGDVNTSTQYNIGGIRALSIPPSANTFVGYSAGQSNGNGAFNSFLGSFAGAANTTEDNNSFFGASAGRTSTMGDRNSFFGARAGETNTGCCNAFFGFEAGRNNSGSSNAFFGLDAGFANTAGFGNAFFGATAGTANMEGANNSFFGAAAGSSNHTGANNAFFGNSAGLASTASNNSFFGYEAGRNTTGAQNTFVGEIAGITNTTGSLNTIVGSGANVSANNLTNATVIGATATVGLFATDGGTAIGFNAYACCDNSTAVGANVQVARANALVLGSSTSFGAAADTDVGIGTNNPQARLHVKSGAFCLGPICDNSTGRLIVGGSAGELIFLDRAANSFVVNPASGERWSWYGSNGRARLWSGGDKLSVDPAGNMRAAGTITASTTPDLAETIPADESVAPGDVVCADPRHRERVVRCAKTDRAILGVISDGSGGFLINSYSKSIDAPLTGKPLVLAGRVPVKISLENGPIQIGDLLAPSSISGVAMRGTETGPTIGIALEAFGGETVTGTGQTATVLCFLKTGDGNPTAALTRMNAENARLQQQNVALKARLDRLERTVGTLQHTVRQQCARKRRS